MRQLVVGSRKVTTAQLGTTDSKALHFMVDGRTAVRIDPDGSSPRIVAGHILGSNPGPERQARSGARGKGHVIASLRAELAAIRLLRTAR